MNKIKEKIKNNKIEFIFCVIVILLFIFLFADFTPKQKINKKEEKTIEKTTIKEKTTKIMVDIKGAVEAPSVYEMKEGSRIIDVINKAGGLKPNADTSMINLSKKVEDEMAITIYTSEDVKNLETKCAPCECPEVSSACISSSKEEKADLKSNENETSDSSFNSNKKISINTATLEELQTLDGIGAARAKAIIGYRQTNGKFKKIEEIKNVSGIGDSIFEKIKDNITI